MSARTTARRLIDKNIHSLGCPLGLSDLSDVAIVCDFVDELQEMIAEDPDWESSEEILGFAEGAAAEILLDEGFPIIDPKTGHLTGCKLDSWEE